MKRLKLLRILFAAGMFLCVNLFLFGLAAWASVLLKIQLLPALLGLNVAVVVTVFAVTALFGRVYCSTVCPMGVLQDCVIGLRRLLTRKGVKPRCPVGAGRNARYVSLSVAVTLFVCGFVSVGALLDGYSLYGRIAAHVFRPVAAFVNNQLAAWLVRGGHPYLFREEVVVSVGTASVVAACGLVGIVLLAWFRSRWFCTALCPVGAALSVASIRPVVKIVIDPARCVKCGLCGAACSCGAIDPRQGRVDQSSCVRCMDCVSVCAKGAVKIGLRDTVKKQSERLLVGVVFGLGCASSVAAESVSLVEASFRASCDGSQQPYVELVPEGFKPERGALIALHGHGSDRWQFVRDSRGECKASRDAARERGLLFVSPDYRGKTSWMGPKGESDLLDLLEHLRRQRGVTSFYICGGSMGGTGALTFAARNPSLVKGVVALNPLADHLSYANFQDAISASFGGDKVTARDEYFKRSAVNYPERFVMPVSITTGGADTSVPPESARRLAKKISFCRPDLIYYDEVPTRRHETDYAASKKAFDEMFRRVERSVPRFLDNTIRLAAVNSSAPDRAAATFVCTGENDEAVFNRAVDLLPLGGKVILSDGDYYFDACTNTGGSAVFLGFNEGRARSITFAGVTDSKAYNTRYGAGIHVTEKAMRGMATNGVYRVFFGSPEKPKRGEFGPYPGDFFTYTHVNNLRLENLQILFYNASKPLRGVDGANFGSLYLKKVYIYQESYFNDRFMHIGRPEIPCAGTVGVWSVPGSNDEAAEIRYDHVQVGGLHTGFVFNGVDHLIMEVCGACRCVQGYDFRCGAKTLTILNCADEGNTYLPRFRGRFGHVTMLDFNIERFNARFIPVDPEPGRTEHRATEEFPGCWRGDITYTLQGGCFGFGPGANPFWAPGHGKGVRTTDQNAPRKDIDLSATTKR